MNAARKILWLTWKDRSHPQAGGAEVINEEIAKRLAADGHQVLLLTAGFPGSAAEVARDGFRIVRVGGRFSVYFKAWRYYRTHLREWPDLVIDEVNTMPFFARFYSKQPVVLFFHQLCRQIWFYQMPLPFAIVGYLLEPFYLWLLRKGKVITVSKSTQTDLMRYGFRRENIQIISEGIELKPLQDLSSIEKFPQPTLLSLGAIRPMKRTMHILKAFEIAKQLEPELRLIIAGDTNGAYAAKVLRAVDKLPFKADIEVAGRVSSARRLELMQKAHLVAVTSVKEGWCLVVTEANSQGTPAVAYDIDGLRDSIRNKETGLITDRNIPCYLADRIWFLLHNPEKYEQMRENAWRWSKQITFTQCYHDFCRVLLAGEPSTAKTKATQSLVTKPLVTNA